MTGEKGETECRFIRRNPILIRSDQKFFQTFQVLH